MSPYSRNPEIRGGDWLGAAAALYALGVLAVYFGSLGLAFSAAGACGLLAGMHTRLQGRSLARAIFAGVVVGVLWPLAVPVYWWLSYPPLRAGALAWEHRGLALGVAVVLTLVYTMATPGAVRTPGSYDTLEQQMRDAHPTDQAARKAAVLEALNGNPFSPPWWLRGGHAQSFWSPFARRSLHVDYRSERLETPDGDFLYVRFFDGEPVKPMVVLFHGLEGSAQSKYIMGYNLAFHALGWNVATMEYRFCSGEINKAQRIYHMGETTDCDFVVRRLAEQHPDRPIYLAGFSLGGNILAKWLGEQGDTVPANVKGAAVISPPFDPEVSAPTFHHILGGFYAWNFLRTLKPKALAKAEQYPGLLDEDVIRGCKDFYTYDTVVTAKLHGFEDAVDYWHKVGCHQFLAGIRVPTMLLTSADDPFNPAITIPHEEADASPWLHPQWTEHGGHVGFIMGKSPLRVRYWAEEQTVGFFQAYQALNEGG
ncbi:MAG: alpha/beta fold hydrolase [Candidatus Hydrogenedens sp.]|nr:alpha/beta fold hydrolase [Candidatus Hydrogenedens sp.]